MRGEIRLDLTDDPREFIALKHHDMANATMRHQSHDIRKVVRLLTSWGRCRHQLSREHMAELCHYVASRLRDMGVIHWLEGGNLLGAVRESGRLLAWEDDVDLSIVLDTGRTFDSLAAGLAESSCEITVGHH